MFTLNLQVLPEHATSFYVLQNLIKWKIKSDPLRLSNPQEKIDGVASSYQLESGKNNGPYRQNIPLLWTTQ